MSGKGISDGIDRREFLAKGGSLVAGALALTSCKRKAQPLPANPGDTINLAIIGVGLQGRTLIDASRLLPSIRYKAVCDIWDYNRNRAVKTFKARGTDVNGYVDYREMLDSEDIDAVIVATPDFVHHEHAIAAMKAGKHVYCEKLMSNSIDKARQMVAASRETGKLLQIGHQRRSNPRYLHVHQRLLQEEKLFGRVTAANAQWNRAVSKELGFPKKYAIDQRALEKYGYESMQHFRNWRWYKKYGGGPISDLGAHQIDIFNWFFGAPPVSVMASGGIDYYPNYEWEDNVMAIYEFKTPGGIARAFYQVQTTTSAGGGYFEYFMGTDGAVKISENPKHSRIFKEAHASGWSNAIQKGVIRNYDPAKRTKPWEKPVVRASSGDDDDRVDARETAALDQYTIPVQLDVPPHQPHLVNFFEAIRGRTKLNCPAETAFESAVTVLKVSESIQAGKLMIPADQFRA